MGFIVAYFHFPVVHFAYVVVVILTWVDLWLAGTIYTSPSLIGTAAWWTPRTIYPLVHPSSHLHYCPLCHLDYVMALPFCLEYWQYTPSAGLFSIASIRTAVVSSSYTNWITIGRFVHVIRFSSSRVLVNLIIGGDCLGEAENEEGFAQSRVGRLSNCS